MVRLDETILRGHYAEHLEKPFYNGLEEHMKSSPVIVMAWEGFECVEAVRTLVGATNPRAALAGTIRGDFSIGIGRNLVHASDSKESGTNEVARFFTKDELLEYDKSEYLHLYEEFERK
jgi:nucleoside-diphosphate kinase